MLYLGIDLHSKQLTVNPRGEDGEVMMRRQVSTRGDEPRNFLAEVARLAGDGGYIAILEVCGFHDWFTELLPQCGFRDGHPAFKVRRVKCADFLCHAA